MSAVQVKQLVTGKWRIDLANETAGLRGLLTAHRQPVALALAAVLAAHLDMDVEFWSSACAPGGWVCGAIDPGRPDGVCGMPVESEYCPEHTVRTVT